MPRRAPPSADWAVLIYMCADNDLEASAVADLRELKRVGSNDRLHVLAQVDRYHAGRPTRRYRLRKGTSLRSDAVGPSLGETDTGKPGTLVDFARWAADEYPARRTLLVIWNHGQGVDDGYVYARAMATGTRMVRRHRSLDTGRPVTGRQLSTAALRRVVDLSRGAIFPTSLLAIASPSAIGFDDHARDFLTTREVHQVTTSIRRHLGRPIDILGFDACLMSMVEIFDGMQENARCTVASEETIPLEGWPYDDILRYLAASPEATAEDLAEVLVREYVKSYARDRRVTLAATSLGGIEPLAHAVDGLCRALLARRGDTALRLALEDARRKAWRSSDTPEYVDLGSFCAALRARTRLASVKAGCADVIGVLRRDVVLASDYRGKPSTPPTGLTVFLPDALPEGPTLKLYERLPFAKRTAWGRFVRAYATGW